MKFLTLLTFLTLTQTTFASSSETICKPSDYLSTIFANITVRQLPDAAQNLLQIRGEGIDTAVDLLCAMEKCTGFMNGLKTTGSTVTTDGVLKSVSIKIVRTDENGQSFNFNCL